MENFQKWSLIVKSHLENLSNLNDKPDRLNTCYKNLSGIVNQQIYIIVKIKFIHLLKI